jgi:hypothetical protein
MNLKIQVGMLIGATTVGMNDERLGESRGVIGVWNETGIRGRTVTDISRQGRFGYLERARSSNSISKSSSESTYTLLKTVCDPCVDVDRKCFPADGDIFLVVLHREREPLTR